MSVICQNFVQNAWKKDLCSNCFKSVSDHDLTDITDENICENQKEDFRPKFISKVTNGFSFTSDSPHTTWKNLISEKNNKHNQPFKLENGFQGRLLTINKACTNEGEKRVFKSNGFLTKSSSSDDILNDRSKEQKATNGWHLNGSVKLKNGFLNDKLNNELPTISKKPPEVRTQPKLVKSKSEDSLSRPLHSILKKTVSTPTSSSSGRRLSSVGFIEEEPLVIGYGGRDFTPEELEWDMNTSDIENEKAWDSLDETEDDKAFSKITKQNTEFNADNSNLLKNAKQPENKNNKHIVISENKVSKVESSSEKKTIIKDNPSQKTVESLGPQIENGNINQAKRSSNNCANHSKQSGEDSFRNGNQLLSNGDRDKRNLSNDPVMKGDKESRVFSPGEVSLAESKKVDRNNLEEGTLPSVTPPRNGEASHPVMFTDEKEQDANSRDEEKDAAGQILQAINTSLTNRHNMNGEEKEAAAIQKLELASSVINEVAVVKNAKLPATSVVNSDKPNADESESSDDESTENGTVMEPRASFLHGISVKTNSKPPSAIYNPASDLFVSRGDSSSSTSTEDVSTPTISHSINVIVNGKRDLRQKNEKFEPSQTDVQQVKGINDYKPKPKIPVKPLKQHDRVKSRTYNRTNSLDSIPLDTKRKTSNSSVTSNGYYSISNTADYGDEREPISLVDHYAESNIYHEVDDSGEGLNNASNPREYKLAALAVELEQVRANNTKRQAPAPPPKIPDPPCEEPPTNMVDTLDNRFHSFRGEVTRSTFSSSSSTASTSSQDTETGYASWNLNGTDTDDPCRGSKKPKSFLLSQYSKCKMLAMDGAKARKKFSLKKLLKGKKEDDAAAFDPNSPNPKAWKYGDYNDRPRAKLEIIHPMDLKNKSVTVNPGFDTRHSGSLSSFASADDVSLRNSVSSDYGSFYSDTLAPVQDKEDGTYEAAQIMQKDPEELSERNSSNSMGSPTPSRISSGSQASTLTSGSSKNDGISPQRPPKPPPPPRAHSLLPGNKALNPDGTFKFPVSCNSVNTIESTIVQLKPQAPKRHCKPALLSADTGVYDNTTGLVQDNAEIDATSDISLRNSFISIEGSSTVLDIGTPDSENQPLQKIDGSISSMTLNNDQYESDVPEPKQEYPSINVTVKAKPPEQYENVAKMTTIIRNKPSPITKAPARPPPIYMKSQLNHISKNPSPWKTLEESYLYLSQANRDLLVKLVNQSLKKRKHFWSKLNHMKFQWMDFEIDVDQPSDVFAFGEKISYHATMPEFKEYAITLVVTVQQQQTRQPDVEPKYPVLGQFTDYIPKELLDNNSDMELESIQATTLILDHSTISTIECFSDSLPQSLTEDHEKELCFIILQVIHSLKSLQAQGVESIDSSVQNLILAKTKADCFSTLIFLTDNCFEESDDYMSESCKISLCQYVLMLLFQLLGVQTAEEFALLSPVKFSSEMSRKVFEVIVSLLVEEKAVSLSQTKILMECYLWDVTKMLDSSSDADDLDNLLHRWMDIKRCQFIKTAFNDSGVCEINTLNEYLTQFLVRASVRNIKEVISYL